MTLLKSYAFCRSPTTLENKHCPSVFMRLWVFFLERKCKAFTISSTRMCKNPCFEPMPIVEDSKAYSITKWRMTQNTRAPGRNSVHLFSVPSKEQRSSPGQGDSAPHIPNHNLTALSLLLAYFHCSSSLSTLPSVHSEIFYTLLTNILSSQSFLWPFCHQGT